jgi:hypothetical protein
MSALAHADAGRGEVTNDSPGLRNQQGFRGGDVTLYRTTDDDAGARYGSDHYRFATQRQISSDPHVSLDSTEDLEGAIPSDVAADYRGAAND